MPCTFKFNDFWASIPGFDDVMHKAWNEHISHMEPYHVLFHKLMKTGLRLSEWSRGLFAKSKLHLHVAVLVILQLDVA